MSENKKPKEPFAYQAARFSWIAPIIAIVINCAFSNSTRGKYEFGEQIAIEDRIALGISSLLSLSLLVCGLAFAIIALMRMKQHGKHGIFGHALAGLIINGLFFALFALAAILAILSS